MLPRTGVEALDVLRREALDSLLWRQRLPVLGSAAALDDEEARAALRPLLGALSADAAKLLVSERMLDALLALHQLK